MKSSDKEKLIPARWATEDGIHDGFILQRDDGDWMFYELLPVMRMESSPTLDGIRICHDRTEHDNASITLGDDGAMVIIDRYGGRFLSEAVRGTDK